MLCCFKYCFNGYGLNVKNINKGDHTNPIVLDTNQMGHEVVIIKNGLRICGTGGALCTAPLVQSKSYFEVKLQQNGVWSIGLATSNTDLDQAPGGCDSESWVLRNDGSVWHNSAELYQTTESASEGDIIGVSFDHIELNFYINGKSIEKPVTGIRGSVYPAVFVDDGAILDVIVDNFNHSLPSGFERIMLEQSLL